MVTTNDARDAALVALAGPLAQYQRIDAAKYSTQLVYRGRCALMGYSLESQLQSQLLYGQKTSPTAGEIIASIASLAAGYYRVKATTSLSGTVGASDFNNMVIHLAGNPITSNIMVDSAYQQPFTNPDQLIFAGDGNSLGVHAIAAGTAGSIYSVRLAAEPADAGIVRMYDGIDQSGLQIASSDFGPDWSDTRWFGPAGVLAERGLYVTASGGSVSGSIYFVPLPS